MNYQAVFRRREVKFLLNKGQAHELVQIMDEFMQKDKYWQSTICNLYCDTPDFLLIRRSVEKPFYKEKLRLRSYGVAAVNDKVFVELKKKYDGIVYKRRLTMTESAASACFLQTENSSNGQIILDMQNFCNVFALGHTQTLHDSQIGREIAYFFERYNHLAPKVFISYSREAFCGKADKNLRITFDSNILWRDYDLSLSKGIYGTPLLNGEQVLMEIKTNTAIPVWLAKWLSVNKIYKTSFSKYGNAYLQIQKDKGEKIYA